MHEYLNAVYVFDLDGVITDPRDSSVDETVVGYIGHILQLDGHVAVNTGRSFTWVQENLLTRLQTKVDTAAFVRLYVVCEKGGESRVWQDNLFVAQPSRFALTANAAQTVKRIYEEHKNDLSTMFWDVTKQTMATLEKYPKADLEAFIDQQTQLTQMLRQELEGEEVKIDATTIAIDVESPQAGKHAGAELIYEWIAKNTSVEHDTFTCFGDSVSDYEMARYFSQQGATTTFVYVGKASDIFNEEAQVKLIQTDILYAAGTRTYFESLSTGK